MSVDASVASSTSQVLVLTVWDVKMGFRVTILLGETEIDHIDLVPALSNAHQEIVWLDVTVNKRFGVDVLDAGDELIGQ